jgi:hypothetical protein
MSGVEVFAFGCARGLDEPSPEKPLQASDASGARIPREQHGGKILLRRSTMSFPISCQKELCTKRAFYLDALFHSSQ